MDRRTYDAVYSRLESIKDAKSLSRSHGVPFETLKVLLCQKIVRETRRRHHKLKADSKRLCKVWLDGESFCQISEKTRFPPVMTASLILSEKGVRRESFKRMLKDVSIAREPRVRKELTEAVGNDLVYSPRAYCEQVARGSFVEEKVSDWLALRGLSFKTEQDARAENSSKTPDFVLDGPMVFRGREVRWIECKATFGDSEEFRRDFKKQLRHYVELFGPGVVVYWYGFLTGLGKEGVTLLSASDIKEKNNN